MPLLAAYWWALLLLPHGNWLGRWRVDRIHPQAFEWRISGLLVLSSGLLIWQSL